MSPISSGSVTNKPNIAPKVDDQDTNPELAAANTLAIKKASSLPHFNQSAGALLSHVEDMEDQQRKEKKRIVDHKTYDQSLQNILNAFEKGLNAKNSPMAKASANHLRCDGHEMLTKNMRSMTLLVANLCLSVFANTADAKSKASQIMTDSQCAIRDQKVKEFQKQLSDQVAAAKKAKKLGIFACVLDWIVSIAEAIYGLFKLVEGVAEAIVSFGCDPNAYLSIAAGAAYTTAGLAGMVKAAAETAKLCGANPKICDQVAKIAGYIQLGAELVGLATDIFGAGMAFKAANGAIKGAATAATKIAGEEVLGAVAKAGTEAGSEAGIELSEMGVDAAVKTIEEVAEEVGESVAEKVSDSVVTKILNEGVKELVEESGEQGYKIAKELGKDLTKAAFKRVTKAFGKDAIKTMVKESLKESMEEAAKQAAKGINRNLTRIISDMSVKIMKKCAYAAVKIMIKATFFTAIYGTGQGLSQGGKGANRIVQGNAKSEIDKIVLHEGFMGLLDQDLDMSRKEEEKQIKDILSKSGTVLQNTKDALEQFMHVSVKIAVSMGRA